MADTNTITPLLDWWKHERPQYQKMHSNYKLKDRSYACPDLYCWVELGGVMVYKSERCPVCGITINWEGVYNA